MAKGEKNNKITFPTSGESGDFIIANEPIQIQGMHDICSLSDKGIRKASLSSSQEAWQGPVLKSVPCKVQGVVLKFPLRYLIRYHYLPTDKVSSEAVKIHLISHKQD